MSCQNHVLRGCAQTPMLVVNVGVFTKVSLGYWKTDLKATRCAHIGQYVVHRFSVLGHLRWTCYQPIHGQRIDLQIVDAILVFTFRGGQPINSEAHAYRCTSISVLALVSSLDPASGVHLKGLATLRPKGQCRCLVKQGFETNKCSIAIRQATGPTAI